MSKLNHSQLYEVLRRSGYVTSSQADELAEQINTIQTMDRKCETCEAHNCFKNGPCNGWYPTLEAQKKFQGGFTLIELIVALGILFVGGAVLIGGGYVLFHFLSKVW